MATVGISKSTLKRDSIWLYSQNIMDKLLDGGKNESAKSSNMGNGK